MCPASLHPTLKTLRVPQAQCGPPTLLNPIPGLSLLTWSAAVNFFVCFCFQTFWGNSENQLDFGTLISGISTARKVLLYEVISGAKSCNPSWPQVAFSVSLYRRMTAVEGLRDIFWSPLSTEGETRARGQMECVPDSTTTPPFHVTPSSGQRLSYRCTDCGRFRWSTRCSFPVSFSMLHRHQISRLAPSHPGTVLGPQMLL